MFTESARVMGQKYDNVTYVSQEAPIFDGTLRENLIFDKKIDDEMVINLYNKSSLSDEIIAQLGNRVQHTLRAYTPSEQKNVKAAADSFRTNEAFDTERTILELGTGEALISFQNEKGEPEVVEKVTILPPQSKMGVIDDMTRNKIINNSTLCGKYDEDIDDRSASEIINETREKENIEKDNQKKVHQTLE